MSAKHQVDALRKARGATTTRVSGHDLEWQGAPHTQRGARINASYWDVAGEGCGKCFCGALSPVLSSANKRRAWHRQHKLDVLAAGDA